MISRTVTSNVPVFRRSLLPLYAEVTLKMKAASSCENEYKNCKQQTNAIGLNLCTCYGHFKLNISTSAVTIGLKIYVHGHLTCNANRPVANKWSCKKSINSYQTARSCILEDSRLILVNFLLAVIAYAQNLRYSLIKTDIC